MKNTSKINKEIFATEPSTVVLLYVVDLKNQGEYRFHAGENGYKNPIVFDKKEYNYYPIKVEGFEMHGDGKLPRPTMTFSNQNGNISMRLGTFKDFINYKVTRIKTFVRYIDDVNFPNNVNPHADPDPESSFVEDIFYVNQKTKENDEIVEFELVSLLELQNANIPARTMYSNYCGWQYRSEIGCGYKGKPISDQKNKRFVPSGYSGQMVGEEVYFENPNGDFGGSPTGDWTRNQVYNKGDVVKIEPLDQDREIYPVDIYVCLNDNVRSNPIRDTENWRLDDCDKTVCGCRLRFGDQATGAGGCLRKDFKNKSSLEPTFWTESGNGIPYGGFPGIDPYEFK
tara:strand:+ start:19319 stop:20341 length:1023 start_codon:yes stop_codon:yes gene_type:complete